MKRWSRIALGGLVVVLAAEGGVRAVEDSLPDPLRWSTPELQYKEAQIDEIGQACLIAVGSSVIDAAFVPEQLEHCPTAYNAAVGAGSLAMTTSFAELEAVPELDPETVVIGLSSRDLNPNDPRQRSSEADYFDSPRVRQLRQDEDPLDVIERWLTDVSAIVRNRAALRDPQWWDGDGPVAWGPANTTDRGTYLQFADVDGYRNDAAMQRLFRSSGVRQWEFGARPAAMLEDFIDELRSQGRRVVVVVTPVTEDYVDIHPDAGDHASFVRQLEELVQGTGAEFAIAGVWDTELFADPVHLNRAGALVFTEWLDGVLSGDA